MSSSSEETVDPKMIPKSGAPTQQLVSISRESLARGPGDFSREFVFDVYDKIAPHFSHTRYKKWPKVDEFVRSLPVGSFIMDAGCGNGKNLMHADHVVRFGSDRSFPFCEIAKEKGKCDTLQADIARDLGKSFRKSVFDAVIAIAVIHHIPDVESRIASIKEIRRLLRVGGTALIYVWAMEQKKGSIGARSFESQDIFVPWNLQSGYLKPEEGVPAGKIVPLHRYYHVFTETEFRELLENVPEFTIDDLYYDNNNWAALLRAI